MTTTNVYVGDYSDPNHPKGIRHIHAAEDNTIILTGNDGIPDESWQVEGKIDGDKIKVDFSPKGGPAELTGSKNDAGIKWEDGNEWYSVGLFVGSYSDPNHPGGIRHITDDPSNVAPNGITIKGHDQSPTPWMVTGSTRGNVVSVDFSPKGGPSELKGTKIASGIKWEDGNEWYSIGLFNGDYTDPNHPGGIRHISVSGDSTDANKITIKGTDQDPNQPWTVTGATLGDKIIVDFSPKGGPSNLQGTKNPEGIKWEDGNEWHTKILINI